MPRVAFVLSQQYSRPKTQDTRPKTAPPRANILRSVKLNS